MKYYKLEYDMNRPSTKCLPVPTNSDYGVAVKVFRNGELVNGDLSVGGLSATTKGDWKLVDLSSGSTEGIGELDVRIEGDDLLGNFKLLISAQDKGYIEVKKEEPVEDEPAPDNDGE